MTTEIDREMQPEDDELSEVGDMQELWNIEQAVTMAQVNLEALQTQAQALYDGALETKDIEHLGAAILALAGVALREVESIPDSVMEIRRKCPGVRQGQPRPRSEPPSAPAPTATRARTPKGQPARVNGGARARR